MYKKIYIQNPEQKTQIIKYVKMMEIIKKLSFYGDNLLKIGASIKEK